MPSVAPLVAALKRRLANLPGPLRASGEASNGEPVQVELLVAGVWVDITSYCMVRDDSGQIRITYGIQGGEGSQTERAQATLQLRNTDGRFSPRNPTGEYYDTLNWRNAQIRISVPDGNGGKSYRIWGEVAEWAPNWDSTGTDVWVDVTVYGILQRLAQGPAPERSVIYTAITDPLSSAVVAYWPGEDPTGATSLAAGLTNGSPMTWTGTLTLASYAGFGASDPLPDLTTAVVSGGVSRYDDPTAHQVRFLAHIPADGLSDGKVLCAYDQLDYSAGSPQFWELYYSTTTRSLVFRVHDADGSPLGAELSHDLDVRGRLLYVSIEQEESGTGATRALRLTDVTTGTVYSVTDTAALTSLTRITSVQFGPASRSVVGPIGTQYLPGVAIGHVTVENTITATDALGARLNPLGEAAGRRIQRICGEEGIPFDWVGDLDDTVELGAQGKQNPLSLMQDAVLADGGLLYENRAVLGLGYRTRASLYNQDPALILSYTGYNLAQVPVPVEDDRHVQNVLTVTVGGVSATYEETDGALGTEAIGRYGETSGLTLNLASTDTANLRDHAAWRVHLGTVDEARFPQISVNLAHSSITPAMRRAILALRLGDRVQITSPPVWLPPDTIDQLIVGIDPETITHFEHRLTFTCVPASPYTVGVLNADDVRIDTDGSELLSAVSSSAAEIDVIPSAEGNSLWTTADADAPWDIRVGGEVMRVTGCTSYIYDSFSRTETDTWGAADSSQTWSLTGTAADFDVSSGYGSVTLPATGIAHLTTLAAPSADVDLYVDVATSALATGASLLGGPIIRAVDNNNHYMARLEFTTSATIVLTIRKRVAGTETVLATYTPSITHVAGTFYRIRFQAYGARIRAKLWELDEVQPGAWHAEATDSSLSVANNVGTRSFSNSGNTNVNPEVRYDNFDLFNVQTMAVTRSINGVVKAQSAGTDVRLANPWILAL